MRRLKSLVCDEDAAEIVEFALAAAIVFALIYGIIQFSLVMYTGNFVATAAQQGTRYAAVRGSDWTSPCASASSYGCKATADDVQNYVLSLTHPGINLTASNVTVTWLTTTAAGGTCAQYSQGCQVEVKVSYTYPLNIPFFSATIPLSSTSIETIQD
jgi:Flp pilus assembly protein TadG